MALQRSQGPGLFFSSVIIFYTDGRTPWTSDKPAARQLSIHRPTKHRISAYTDIYALSGIRTHDLSVLANEDKFMH
jgi:hypothetical protein